MVSIAEDTIKTLFHFYTAMATTEQPHKHGLYYSSDQNNGYLLLWGQMYDS